MYQEIIDKFKSIKDTLEEDILKIRSFSELFKKLGHSGLKFDISEYFSSIYFQNNFM